MRVSRVTVRDGVELMADIYFPALEGIRLDERMKRVATNTVHLDASYPAHIVLPIVPDGEVVLGSRPETPTRKYGIEELSEVSEQ